MPIGFDAGDFGGDRRNPDGISPGAFSEIVRGGQPLVGQVWSRWETAEDELVCPECGPLDGESWPLGEGPEPPLHNHCRCERVVAFVAFSSRQDD